MEVSDSERAVKFSFPRRSSRVAPNGNRKAWPGDETEEKSPKSGNARARSKKKKKSKSKEETKEETSSPQRGKQFKAPTQKKLGLSGRRGCESRLRGSGRRPVGQVRHGRRGEYEDRQKRSKKLKKRRAENRSKRFKKLWQMFGVPETIKLETVAAREAVNALNLTQKDLRHLKREFDEIDVDQSGPVRFAAVWFYVLRCSASGPSRRRRRHEIAPRRLHGRRRVLRYARRSNELHSRTPWSHG